MIFRYWLGWIGHATPVLSVAVRIGVIGLARNHMKSISEDRWLSIEEIAEYLGIKRDTIYKWIVRKSMPAHKVGSLWKFKREEIDDWVRKGNAAEPKEAKKPR